VPSSPGRQVPELTGREIEMGGNLFVGRILMGLGSQPASKAPEVELEPMQPGAWAAWAKANTSSPEAAGAPAAKASNPAQVKGTLVAAKG
jgi:hypothetical protein